jgi:protein SCO1/2
MFKYKIWIYVGFFVLLLAGFYWAIIDERPFQESKLKVINPQIPDFNFTDQNHQPFTKKTTEGKVYVAEYFFTTCKGICPKMNTSMRRVYDAYKDNTEFLIASHTCMPEVDSVPLMKAYERKMLTGHLNKKQDGSFQLIEDVAASADVKNSNWFFLTGDKSQLYQLARQGYIIDNGKPDSSQVIADQFIHSQFFSLVDRYGRVRGIYDGLKEEEIDQLINDIEELLDEKITTARFMNGFSSTPN